MKKKLISILLIICFLFSATLISACNVNPNDALNNSQIENPSEPENPTQPENPTNPENPTQPETPKEEDDNVNIRFSVMSDIHIGDKDTEQSMRKGLQKAKSISNNKLDMVLFNGDLTHTTGTTATPSTTQITTFKNIYDSEMQNIPSMYALGPTHDTPESGNGAIYRNAFESVFGSKYYSLDKEPENIKKAGARHVELNGYHFYTIDWDGAYTKGLNSIVITWLKQELITLTKEDADRPIFVLYHVPSDNFLTTLLKDFPQVVLFTAHVHNSIAREDSISQDKGFTQVHCGGMNYYRVDAYNRFNSNPYLNLGNIYNFAQNLYVEVDDANEVTITRVDAFNNDTISTPWKISPDNRNSYTSDRIATAKPCYFSDNATLKIGAVATNGSIGQVGVSFDTCEIGGAGPANYYGIELYQKSGSSYVKTTQADLSSQHVFFPNNKNIPKGHYSYTFTNVKVDDFAIVVKAYDCWHTSSNALVYSTGGYVYEGEVGGKVEHSLEARQELTFLPTSGLSATRYSSSYTSMGVRFNPTAKFTEVKLRCSSHADLIGTLEFKLYKWNETYEKTLQGEVIDSYTMSGFKGSTIYTIFNGKYDASEYLIDITTPNYSEGVGLYVGNLTSPNEYAYLTYVNHSAVTEDLYFEWTNLQLTSSPYIPIN